MDNSLKQSIQQAGQIAFVGLALGVISGWISRLKGADAVAAAAVSSQIYWTVIIGIPLALMWLGWVDHQQSDVVLLRSILMQWLCAGLGGAIAASLLFIVGAAQIPAVFGDVAFYAVVSALYPQIGWAKFLTVLALSGVMSVAIALWYYQQSKRVRSSDPS